MRSHHRVKVQCCCRKLEPPESLQANPNVEEQFSCSQLPLCCAGMSKGLCSDKIPGTSSHTLDGLVRAAQNLGPEGNCATLSTTRQNGGNRNSARSGRDLPAQGMTCVGPGRLHTFYQKKNPRNYQQSPPLRFPTQLSAAPIYYLDR